MKNEVSMPLSAGNVGPLYRMDQFLMHSNDLYCCLGDDGILRAINTSAVSILGCSPEQLESNLLISFIHPDDIPLTLQHLDIRTSNGSPFSFGNRFLTGNGTWKWLHWEGHADKESQCFYLVARDIDSIKQTEAALKESESRLRNVLEGTNVGFWDWYVQTGELRINERWANIVGYQLSELTPVSLQTWLDLAHPEDLEESNRLLQDVFDRNKIYYDFECRMKHRDGSWVWIHDRGKVIEWSADGLPIRMSGTHSDITGRKSREKKLRESEERLLILNATKDKFFSIIAHDLRNPFNTIIGLSNILIDKARDRDFSEVEKYSSVIRESSEKAMALLKNLMQWARSQTDRIEFSPEPIKMPAIISQVVEDLKNQAWLKGINIRTICDPTITSIADKEMLCSILRNLVSNAIKFTNSHGEIIITVSIHENELLIDVRDNGTGMSKNTMEGLFRLDSNISTCGTMNEQGTGLGLILCREFVERHHGRIWAESEEGKGSVFSFSLPMMKETTIEKDKPVVVTVEPKNKPRKLKILICDDDHYSAVFLRGATKDFSHEVILVRNGSDAVSQCMEHPDLDIIFMDIQMPGMNGLEAIRNIRQFNTDAIIVVQTASDSRVDQEQAATAGCNGFLVKPLTKENVREAVMRFFPELEKASR